MRKSTMKKAVTMGMAALALMGSLLTTGLDVEAANSVSYADTTADSENTVTLTCLPELAEYVWQGYNDGQYGPVTITRGRLTQDVPQRNWLQKVTGHDVQTYDVYLVTLSGTEDVENQTTDWKTDLQAGFGFESDYTRNVVQTILENVPEGSNLFIAGHSLGGMVAQQVIADEQIKERYEVKFTVTFGSPAVGQGSGREGQIRRMGVHNDVVPNLSTNIGGNISGTNWEGRGKYGVNQFVKAHCEGYLRDDIFGHWNVCGDKLAEAPSAKLELDLSTLTFYQSLKGATNSNTGETIK